MLFTYIKERLFGLSAEHKTAYLKISEGCFTNFQDILTALEGTFETNITTDEMMSLVRMQLDSMASWEFINQKVLGEYEFWRCLYAWMGINLLYS